MRIFRRGSTWWYDFSIGGQRVRGSCDTDNEAKARQVLAEKHSQVWQKQKLGVRVRRSWAEATERYLKEHEALRTIETYRWQSEWWTEAFKLRNLTYIDELHPDVIKVIRDQEFARPKLRGGGKRSVADVNRKIAYLRAVVNAVYREYRWLEGEPPLYRMLPGEIERDMALEPAQVLRLAEVLPEPYGIMAKFAVATGLRRGNVLKLRWEYVDLGARMIRLPHQVMKNGKALRLPLNSMAVEILRSQWGKSDEWVFPRADGTVASEVSSKVWDKATKAAGLDGFRWHDLRHTWATILGESGVSEQEIQRLGGWKDARMVKRYANLSVDHLSKAAEVVSESFGTNPAQGGLRKVG
jgi:integrase